MAKSRSPMIDRRLLVVGGLSSVAAHSFTIRERPLRGPFDAPTAEWRRIGTLGLPPQTNPAACMAAPPPIHDLNATTYYTDRRNSVVDYRRMAQWERDRAPLLHFTTVVEQQAEIWLASLGRRRRAVACAGDLLGAWAQADALLGSFNAQGAAAMRWSTAGLAVAYLAVRSGLDESGSASRIAEWFGRLGRHCRAGATRLRNNHLYWAAAAAAGSAIAANDRATFAWAMRTGRIGINAIAPDGTLPLELARGTRALDYHCFALAALVLVAEFGAANGVDLYSENGSALSRLVQLILRNVEDQTEIARLAGERQIWAGATDKSMSWSEMWYARFGNRELARILRRLRPINMPYLGGNQTLLFGRRMVNHP